jgi:penicillin-binding protein 1A
VTVGEAVARSLNPPAVEVLERVGLAEAFRFAREELGLVSLRSPEEAAAHDCTLSSMALGQQSVGVTSGELTAAYTTLYGGFYREAVSYHRVLDRDGNILLENKPALRPVLSEETAALLTRLLMEVNSPENGGTAARYLHETPSLGMETAGKTGTTQGGCDRRYIGMTPRLLAGVWMGYDYPARQGGITGNPCVGIWDELITVCEGLYRGAPPKAAFDLPDTLTEAEFCPLSGGRPNPWCAEALGDRSVAKGWFVRGTEPSTACPLHEEPPITIPPSDPNDPDRIPLLPEDLIPDPPLPREIPPRHAPKKRGDESPLPWISRWFKRFAGRGS